MLTYCNGWNEKTGRDAFPAQSSAWEISLQLSQKEGRPEHSTGFTMKQGSYRGVAEAVGERSERRRGREKFGAVSRGEGRWPKGLESWAQSENKHGREVWGLVGPVLARFQLEQRCSVVSASGLARAPGGVARSFTILLNCDLFSPQFSKQNLYERVYWCPQRDPCSDIFW